MVMELKIVHREYIRDFSGNWEFKDEKTDRKQNNRSGIYELSKGILVSLFMARKRIHNRKITRNRIYDNLIVAPDSSIVRNMSLLINIMITSSSDLKR
jgi:hypothetical protein